MSLVTDLGPGPGDARWRAAQGLLRAGAAPIAHVDTGLAAHPALGFDAVGRPPPNIRMDLGVNFHDPLFGRSRPWTDLGRGAGLVADLIEFPDHGVKTLSVILAEGPRLRGVAPGAVVIPYRVANGPVFRGPARTAAIGDAIAHALGLNPRPAVVSISMGNPGLMGPYDLVRALLGGEVGVARRARAAIDAAYEAGVIVVCAAGQVIETVVEPARLARTIAVGGFDARGATLIHYPRGGYATPRLVDVWARAVAINRAGARPGPDGAPVFNHAEDDPDGGAEASGTSYACPQVAAAAAMWTAAHGAALRAFDAEPWRVVESFRRALRLSADLRPAETAEGPIAVLNVERLLELGPDDLPDRPLRRRNAAA